MSNKLVSAQNGIRITEVTTYPTSPANGMIVYRSDLNGFYAYQGGQWGPLLIGATYFTLPELVVNPPAPAVGFRTIFAKNDGWYQITSAAVVSKIGGSGGGASLNVITDGSFEDSIGNWVANTGTIAFTTPNADLLTSTNLKMLKMAVTGSSVVFDSIAQADYTLPASFLNRDLVMRGWYRTTTNINNLDFVLNHTGGSDNIFVRPIGYAVNTWTPIEFPFKTSAAAISLIVRNVSNGMGSFDIFFDQLTIEPMPLDQAKHRTNGTTQIDLQYAVLNLETSSNITYTFTNPAPGRVTSLIVKNIGGAAITMTFPTSIKRSDIPLSVAAGRTNIYTIIVRWTGSAYAYYIACVSDMV